MPFIYLSSNSVIRELRRQITLAVLNTETQSVTLWEAYQINEKLEQRVTLVGGWTCSSCNKKATHNDSRLADEGESTGPLDESPERGRNQPHISRIAEGSVTRSSDESPGAYSSRANHGDGLSDPYSSHEELGLIPEGVRVEVKATAFGILEAPVDDPVVRRRNLTGLHLSCTTIMVSAEEF